MKLSASIFQLKRRAKSLARETGVPLHEALDQIAVHEGFARWSLLSAWHATLGPAGKLFARLNPGDLVLIGARPGQGKTLMGLQLAVEAARTGSKAVFFTLEYTEAEGRERLRGIGADPELVSMDCSDSICAEYIIGRLAGAERGTLAVVDYLQLLDQKRNTPPLMDQVQALKALATERGIVLVFISQIDRSYDPAAKAVPDLGDVRLPNPLDLGLFDKTCFMNGGEVRFA